MSNLSKKSPLQKKEISRSFNQAAETYDRAAFFQREVANRLLERLDYIVINPKIILDLGAGTGYSANYLAEKYPHSRVISLDLAENMLVKGKTSKSWFKRERKYYVCGDAEQLPFADKSIDLIFSNLMLHWVNDLEATIKELHRVLKPGGLLLFSTLGPDTLLELKQSWANIDNGVHVHSFTDMHFIGDFLQRAKFKESVMDMEFITVTYNDIKKILLDLKDLGTHNIANNRLKGLMGKQKFQRFIQAYEKLRNNEGMLPLTYEVIYGLGWGSPTNEQAHEVSVPLSAITKR